MSEHTKVRLTEHAEAEAIVEELRSELARIREEIHDKKPTWRDSLPNIFAAVGICGALFTQYLSIQTRLLTIELNQKYGQQMIGEIQQQHEALKNELRQQREQHTNK